MANLDLLIDDLVTANRILAQEGVVDSFGHVSVRHPEKPDHYLLSRARAPDCIEPDDIITFKLDGTPVNAGDRKPYMERFIHGAIYEARPEVQSVVHNHSPSVIPFGVTGTRLRPILHMCGNIGHEAPIWDSRDKFGDTDLLVTSMEMGRDLAKTLGGRRTGLMRGHGAVVAAPDLRLCIYSSVYLEVNAKLQMQAMAIGEVKYLSSGEVDAVMARTGPYSVNRAWENWCRRAGRPFIPQ